MKSIIILSVFLISLNNTFAQPDYSDFDRFFGVQVNTGITFYQLNPLKDAFNNYINNFRANYNIPLKVQHLYPANISWSFYLFWYFSQGVSIIIGPEYASTTAYSRYEDYAGALDIKSEIEEIFLSIGITNHFYKLKFLQPLIGISLGVTQYIYSDETKLTIYNQSIPLNNDYEYTDHGYFFEPFTGFTKDIEFAVLTVILSYKIVKLNNLEIEPNNLSLRLGFQKGIFK